MRFTGYDPATNKPLYDAATSKPLWCAAVCNNCESGTPAYMDFTTSSISLCTGCLVLKTGESVKLISATVLASGTLEQYLPIPHLNNNCTWRFSDEDAAVIDYWSGNETCSGAATTRFTDGIIRYNANTTGLQSWTLDCFIDFPTLDGGRGICRLLQGIAPQISPGPPFFTECKISSGALSNIYVIGGCSMEDPVNQLGHGGTMTVDGV